MYRKQVQNKNAYSFFGKCERYGNFRFSGQQNKILPAAFCETGFYLARS